MSELLIPNYLRAAVVNQRIYPPGSPIVERSVTQILQTLSAPLAESDRITFTSRQGKLFLKNKEIPDGASLCPYLDEHGLQSLSFLTGVTAAEISQLVILLSRKKLPGGNAAEWLRSQQVTHVQVDKITMVELLEGEVVQKKVDQLFEGLRDFPGMLTSLRESYDMIDKIPDEAGKAKVQEHIARKLALTEPSLLRDMFENELPKHVEDSGLKTMVLNAMTQDKIHDIFSEIGNWYRQIRAQTNSDFEVVEHLNKLKSFLGKLLNAPASKQVPFAVFEEMLNEGLIDQIPAGVEKKPEEESLASQVDHLLERPGSALLEQPARDQLPFILKKLCDVGLDDMSQRLVEKFVENFSQDVLLLRQMAAHTAKNLMDVLWANRKERLWKIIAERIEKMADSERAGEVYKELADALSSMVHNFILHGRSPEAVRVLALLRRHGAEDNPLMPKRRETATQTLQQLAASLTDVLTEELLSDDKNRKEAAQDILAHFGENAVPCFIRLIKKSGDLRHRRLAAGVLKYFGESAKSQLAAEFQIGNPTDVLLNILGILEDFLTPDLIPRFENFLHYPDPTIRRRLIHLLARIPSPDASRLLTAFLDDGDESVLVEAVRAVGETRHHGAVEKLCNLLKNGTTRQLEETCLALGHLGNDKALDALLDILEPKSGLFKKRAAVEETVRVRAAWAIAQFKSVPARDALTRLLKDPNLQVQNIARTALAS
ncbi:MAG TPA: HEAT repeat domain-containing protein [Elusimicrobiota bacterium]|nr:HEAT repeat domain-containing protein [Elusimicrobiota bacterium]